jgi:Transposase zinc-binding domain/Putative transposase
MPPQSAASIIMSPGGRRQQGYPRYDPEGDLHLAVRGIAASVVELSAIERCRTAALGGHVERCADCACTNIVVAIGAVQNARPSSRLAEREAELLPVPYFHVVFTLPARIASIAYQNKALVYDLLFEASSEAVLTIATDPEHLGARIGITAVLNTCGSTMTHHPHVHMIVPGGGIALDEALAVVPAPLPCPCSPKCSRG